MRRALGDSMRVVVIFWSAFAAWTVTLPLPQTPFPASHELLRKLNEQAAREGLERIWDSDLESAKASGLLMPLPKSNAIAIDSRLDKKFRYCTPCTATFLEDFGKAFHQRFKRPIQVNSAVRTVEYQRELKEGRLVKRGKRWVRIGRNPNAADYEGPEASSHLFGSTVDIAKLRLTKGGIRATLSAAEISWMRVYLKALRDAGLIEVMEEFNQAVFHVMVFAQYCDAAAPE